METLNLTPFTQHEWVHLLAEYQAVSEDLISQIDTRGKEYKKGLRPVITTPEEEEEDRLKDKRRQLKIEYFERLPRLPLSRCPFCGQLLVQAFDPWGVEGLLWQHDEISVKYRQPDPCEHFRLLLGALNLHGLPPKGGRFEALVGPDVPYVIARILNLPTMVVVISAIHMHNGYTAYPLAYFSEQEPPVMSLTTPWTRMTYYFQYQPGVWKWTDTPNDPWDFEIGPWVTKGKVKWIDPGDETMTLRQQAPCPYQDLEGTRMQQVIEGNELETFYSPGWRLSLKE